MTMTAHRTMQIATNVQQLAEIESLGGKDIHHVAWYDVDRGPVATKHVMDVVTDDWTVYRWTRFNDDEPWNFEHRETPNGERDTANRVLPTKVRELLNRDGDLLYT